MTLRPSIKALTGLTASALVALTMALALAPSASAEMQRGCPDYAFCIYAQNRYWNEDRPSYIMRPDYGTYVDHQHWNLKNHGGTHKVFNNAPPGNYQYVNLNTGLNGAGQGQAYSFSVAPGKSYDLDLGRVYSITIWWKQLTNNM